ncbi:MAG: hypothetical protein WC350_01965 [Candidatus Micrarchaeia archaeon]|jgi:preprotein translocase subunit SecD
MDHKKVIIALALLFAAGIYAYPVFAGLVLMCALILFGALSHFWEGRELKLICLGAIILLAGFNLVLHGMKFGIDFSGGTRIPVVLEQPAQGTVMDEMVNSIKKRASAFGLTEVKVRAVGDSQINVEVPSSDPEFIRSVEDILSQQGVYTGVVDGKAAMKGEFILPGTIYQISASQLQGEDWGVGFSVNRAGAELFASVVNGKAYYPVYMFLDRPNDAVIVASWDELKGTSQVIDRAGMLTAMRKALALEGNDIELYVYDGNLSGIEPGTNQTKAIISKEMNASIGRELRGLGFNVVVAEEGITPTLMYGEDTQEYVVEEWPAVGLLSSPSLSPDIATGIPAYNFRIGGVAQGAGNEKALSAYESAKKIESILKGGALPVQISIGSKTVIPAPLGEEFLRLSIIGLGLSLIAISALVSLRYRKMSILLPIIVISFSEMVILLSVIGSFTIDLAAMAGIIAAIGVGVDSQIVITDELLKKEGSRDEKLGKAFDIVTTTVTVAVFAMVPLLFSGMVEIIGFAISTILGALLGLLLSRPAYAAIVEGIGD